MLFACMQWLCLAVSDITQEGSKQVNKEKRIWARTPGAFQRQAGQQLVLVFGNSKIGAGFYPEVFDEVNQHKTNSYNMALIGLQLPPHYFLLKDFIKHNGAPDWILLQYSTGGFEIESFPSYSVQGAGFFEALQYAYYRKNLDVFLNYIIPSRLHWPEVTRYFFGKILQWMPQKIKDAHKNIYLNSPDANNIYGHNRKHFYESQFVYPEKYHQQIIEKLHQDRGYYYIAEQAAEGGVISAEYLVKVGAWNAQQADGAGQDVVARINDVLAIDKLQDAQTAAEIPRELPPFVEDFFKLTKENHIKVMIIDSYELSPTGRQPISFDKHIHALAELKRLQERYPNIYFPLEAKGPMSMGFEYFSDPGHVNLEGAKKYTAILAQEYKELSASLGE